MMRQIKFRAWSGVDWLNLDEWPINDINISDGIRFSQYTGLKDKNGVEIYSGDIIQFLDGSDCSTEAGFDWDEYANKGVVSWSDREARFTVSNMDMIDIETLIEGISETEVVGNIYENPELIK